MEKTKTSFKRLSLFALSLFAVALSRDATAANSDLAVPAAACTCDLNQKDKYEGPNQIAFGAFAGQCLDTCRFRRSIVLGANPWAPDTRKAVITNFMHDGSYWKAQVPLTTVESVEVGFEEFIPGVFHVFLLFQFPERSPVRLDPQIHREHSLPTRVHNLVISPEGIPPRDGKYNFLDAFMERYPVGIRTLSKQQVIHWSVDTLKHKVQVFALKLDPQQRQELLRSALHTVATRSFQTKYRLFTNNCATSVLDLIDSVVKPDVTRYPVYADFLYAIERALPIAGPIGTLKVFLTRNLINEGSGRSILD
jgi:hypothetical protein